MRGPKHGFPIELVHDMVATAEHKCRVISATHGTLRIPIILACYYTVDRYISYVHENHAILIFNVIHSLVINRYTKLLQLVSLWKRTAVLQLFFLCVTYTREAYCVLLSQHPLVLGMW